MSSNKKRLNLSFSMASPIQRQAWKRLMDIPAGKRTEHVCRMICEHKNQQELLDAVCQVFVRNYRAARSKSQKQRQKPRASKMMSSTFLLRCRRKEMIQPDSIL